MALQGDFYALCLLLLLMSHHGLPWPLTAKVCSVTIYRQYVSFAGRAILFHCKRIRSAKVYRSPLGVGSFIDVANISSSPDAFIRLARSDISVSSRLRGLCDWSGSDEACTARRRGQWSATNVSKSIVVVGRTSSHLTCSAYHCKV